MRNIYLLLLFTVLYSANAQAQEYEYTKPNPYILCLAHINKIDLYTISPGKRIKVDFDDRKVKGVVEHITSDSVFFKGGVGIPIASIHRIKVPLPERKVLALAVAIPSVAVIAAVPVLFLYLSLPAAEGLFFTTPYMLTGGAGLFGSFGLGMKWFETSYEWKLTGMTFEDLKRTYGDRVNVRIIEKK